MLYFRLFVILAVVAVASAHSWYPGKYLKQLIFGTKKPAKKPVASHRTPKKIVVPPRSQKRCFKKEGLGCFDPLPVKQFHKIQSPAEMKMNFRFHNRRHIEVPIKITNPSEYTKLVSKSGFNNNKDTKIIIHGFYEDANKKWVQEIKRRLLRLNDHNVIVVDWRGHHRSFFGTTAAASTRVVAEQTRLLLKHLKVGKDRIHCIGHNMGAHVCGHLGKRMKRLNRITGLDPRGPVFMKLGPKYRLHAKDAFYVDVIHTDSGKFGTPTPMGHIDFYPNGGRSQPGCGGRKALSDPIRKIYPVNCNSARAAYYYITSMYNYPCKFLAVPCENYAKFLKGECTCKSHGCLRMGHNVWQSLPMGYNGKPIKYFLKTVYPKHVDKNFNSLNECGPVRRKKKQVVVIHGNVGGPRTIKFIYHAPKGNPPPTLKVTGFALGPHQPKARTFVKQQTWANGKDSLYAPK